MIRSVVSVLLLGSSLASSNGEARLSLDVKDGEVTDVVAVLARVGDFQVVFDPDVSCRLTLRLQQVVWPVAFEHVLRACRLGSEGTRRVVRIAPLERLAQETRQRRELSEANHEARSRHVQHHRLSYARAEQLAPVLERLLSRDSEVVYDRRTNTLIIID